MTAAADVMARHGYQVPLAEVAAAAGVGIGTFYRRYPDRNALLRALELRAYDLLVDMLNHIEKQEKSGADRIELFLLGGLSLGDQLVLPLRGAPPLVDEAAVTARRRINTALDRFLIDGKADGTIGTDVNATDVIMCCAMVSQPLAHMTGWPDIARRHVAVFMGGIRATTARPLPGSAITRQDIEALFSTGTPSAEPVRGRGRKAARAPASGKGSTRKEGHREHTDNRGRDER